MIQLPQQQHEREYISQLFSIVCCHFSCTPGEKLKIAVEVLLCISVRIIIFFLSDYLLFSDSKTWATSLQIS